MTKMVVFLLALIFQIIAFCSPTASADQPKILYIDSYHPEYGPNILARKTFFDGIEDLNAEIRYEFMDAKRKKTVDLQKAEALRIHNIIGHWQPDLIVAADDSVNKYLIAPYYLDSSIPIVFNGVNWDASAYGYPATNITGQIEVELIIELISELKSFSRGKRLGIITGDTLTDRKSMKLYSEILNLHFDQISLVNNFNEWKTHFLNLQKTVDILIIRNNSGISGWDDVAAQQFVNANTLIPTGCISNHLNKLSLVCFPKKNEEFGEISARMVNDILRKGKSPADIPIIPNKKSRIYLNMKIAKKLGVTFPMETIENAHLISAEQK